MIDYERINRCLDSIDCTLDNIKDELEVSKKVEDFLLSLCSDEIETFEKAKEIAKELYMKV